ncbi:MAG: CRISPR system precrRNA processing endoribonuclease RAMP protein Cas6 [Lachnospiraceae bacterium]|nr:CRISPR system precrRNA processing endoribonuclease RAMP protein Cas6 [Lachnospiraceae bacterium]
MAQTFDIPYIRLHFSLEMLEDTILPSTKASALRGGMGEMLLRQNCVRDRKCDSCSFQKDCVVWDTLYSRMEIRPGYVTGKESIGYLVECSDRTTHFSAGSHLNFQLTLFGRSIPFFNSYMQAFLYLGMSGLGKYHSRFRISEVKNSQGQRLVYGNEVNMQNYRILSVSDYVRERKEKLSAEDGRYVLVFLSPLNMKFQGKELTDFSGEAVTKGAVRRIQMLNYYLGREMAAPRIEEYPVLGSSHAKKEDIHRYSSTQESKMQISGITGRAVMESVPDECLEYLLAGELTHIGKNTSFGFGKYIINKE